MSIRQAGLDELNEPSATKTETAKALKEWWRRWKDLPVIERVRPIAEVLAEQRQRD